MRVTLLHNPTAGKGKVTKRELIASCELAGHKATYYSTKVADLGKVLQKAADLVVVAGGDGIVSKVAREMLHRRVPLTIIPLGNANNIARSFGIGGTAHELAEGWMQGTIRTLSIGAASGAWGNRKFVEAVGFGPFARVIGNNSVSDRLQGAENLKQGRKELRREFRKAQVVSCALEVDNRAVGGKFIALEVTNIAYAGPGLELAPKADPSAPDLHIVSVRAADRDRMLDWIGSPRETRLPMRSKRGRAISFRWSKTPLRIDDETLKPPKQPTTVNLALAGLVEILVPAKNENGSERGPKRRRKRTSHIRG